MPIGCPRGHVQAREIVILVTGPASDSIYALPVWSTANLHRVTMTIVSLTRKISIGVAIHTARMTEHRHNCFESGSGAGSIVRHYFQNELRSGMLHSLHGNP
jgi:hypothetical protein